MSEFIDLHHRLSSFMSKLEGTLDHNHANHIGSDSRHKLYLITADGVNGMLHDGLQESIRERMLIEESE